MAERIRHQFETATVDVAGTPVKATVSLGIASTETFGYDLDTLMRRADMAVYAAKKLGRNRVVAAEADDARWRSAPSGLMAAGETTPQSQSPRRCRAYCEPLRPSFSTSTPHLSCSALM